MHAPVGGLGGHHVQMAVHQQGRGPGVRAGDPGDDVRTALGALQQRRFEPGVGQPLGDVLGGRALLAGSVTGVAGIDTDQLGGEADHFVQGLLVDGRDGIGGPGGADDPGGPGRFGDADGSGAVPLLLSHIVPPRRKRRRW